MVIVKPRSDFLTDRSTEDASISSLTFIELNWNEMINHVFVITGVCFDLHKIVNLIK